MAATPTGSSSSSGSENVERRDMLDSECRERTEMAESERRGVLMGGCSMETGTSQLAGRAGLNLCAQRGHWAPQGHPVLAGTHSACRGRGVCVRSHAMPRPPPVQWSWPCWAARSHLPTFFV